ncbi:hypothetical protein ACIRYZ_04655 [Kitasatospora sp. NPDC101155]|uniref:hypothetical protein n=1 Tax=Kitasatospora sp. NPDC101155 TaxID=3364097 RepID=UPI0037F67F39
MSDDVLSVIPTDPQWQPEPAAAERAVAVVAELLREDDDAEVEVSWHERTSVVDCGENLERIGCPQCGGTPGLDWWGSLLEERAEAGVATLAVTVPCCGADTTLDALEYDWPCGFARFEIEVWNPECVWFAAPELTAIGVALGHPVRQVRAHL